jgi:hypothetical protein
MIRKEFILSELKYRYPDLTHTIRQPEQAVGRPLMLEHDKRRIGARIIVCRAEELSALRDLYQREPLFLCLGTPRDEVLEQLDVCVLPQTETQGNVLNFVQRLFDRLDEWTQQLKQVAETAPDAEELLNCAAQMLQNPIWLLDERAHVIAHSGSFGKELMPQFTESYNMMELDATLKNGIVKRIVSREGTGALSVAISLGDARYTLFCTAVERALYGSDEVVFESLAGYVRLLLSERKIQTRILHRKEENESIEQALRALLEESSPEQTALDTLQSFGWDSMGDYCLLAVEPANGDLRAQHATAICDLLESSFAQCCAFASLPVIVAVIRAEELNVQSIHDALPGIALTERMRFGVCDAIEGLTLLPQRFALAKRALNDAKSAEDGVRWFSDVAEGYFTERATSEFSPEVVCLQSVRGMAKYDIEHDTGYLETAIQYIKNRFNAVKTANALFIHRSTFLYRLERMKTQFGLDIEDENISMLHLLLSLQLVGKQS